MADFDHVARSYASMPKKLDFPSKTSRELEHFTNASNPVNPRNLDRFHTFCPIFRKALASNEVPPCLADSFVSLIRKYRLLFIIAKTEFGDLFSAGDPIDVRRDLRNIWLAVRIGIQVKDFPEPNSYRAHRPKLASLKNREFFLKECFGLSLDGKILPDYVIAQTMAAKGKLLDPMSDKEIEDMLLEHENESEVHSMRSSTVICNGTRR